MLNVFAGALLSTLRRVWRCYIIGVMLLLDILCVNFSTWYLLLVHAVYLISEGYAVYVCINMYLSKVHHHQASLLVLGDVFVFSYRK